MRFFWHQLATDTLLSGHFDPFQPRLMLKWQRIPIYPDGITNDLLPFCTCCFMKTTFHHINQNYFKVAPDPQKSCLPFSGKYWSLSDSQLISLASTCNSTWVIRPFFFLLHALIQIFLQSSNRLFYRHSGTHRKLAIEIWGVIMNFKAKAPLTGSWQSCYQEHFETKSNGNTVSLRFSCV